MSAAADNLRRRSRIVILTLALGLFLLPTFAGASTPSTHAPKKPAAPATGLKAFNETHKLPSGSTIEPAIAADPGTAGKEWFVASSGSKAEVEAISASGKLTSVSKAITHGAGAIPGNGGALASYGSVDLDGYDWLVKYGQLNSPLYAVSSSGKTTKVLNDVASNITDITVGADGTLDFSSTTQAVGLESCSIIVPLSESVAGNKRPAPTVDCHSPFSLFSVTSALPDWLAGQGQVESLASDGARLWFTDSEGQLGSFQLTKALNGSTDLKHLFSNPYGDAGSGASALGEGAGQADTVAADGSDIYIAGGGYKSAPYGTNHEIVEVRATGAKLGTTVRRWSKGLANVTALTVGPNRNVWFLDSRSARTGAGEVGELNAKSGKIKQYKLARGYKFGPFIADIAAGSKRSGELYFTLETAAGGPAIGEVYGAAR